MTDWHTADCRHYVKRGIDYWFEPDGGHGVETRREQLARVRAARDVCADCPIKAACLDFALTNRIGHGIYAGTTGAQRASTPARGEPKCGTDAGYQAHNRRDETACKDCKRAHTKAVTRRRERAEEKAA